MRRTAVVVLLAAAAVVALLLLSEQAPDRAIVERDPVAPTGGEETPEASATDGTPPAAVRGSVRDEQGDPVSGTELFYAAGFPLETRTFRSGHWPARTVWLCPFSDGVTTGPDGVFALPAPPEGARWIVWTPSSSPVHFAGGTDGGDLRVEAKCTVRGVLRDHAGNAVPRAWVEGRLGPREDWHVRVDREKPMYVSSGGPLEVDDAAPCGVETDDEGRFALRLRRGACTIAFGDQARFGTLPVHVAAGEMDLGEIRIPLGPEPEGEGRHALQVQVYDAQGAPRADAEVLLWDGVVGMPSHSEWTAGDGLVRFEGLRADEVMAWTVPLDRPYLAEPEQCSGRVRLPCDAPVVLRARRPAEYVVLRFADMGWGYCLLLQGDRLIGGVDVTDRDGIALPPGDYHAIVVGRRVILETDLALYGAPEFTVDRSRFTVTMRG